MVDHGGAPAGIAGVHQVIPRRKRSAALEVAARLVWRHLRPVLFQPRPLWKLLLLAADTVRSGGLGALAKRMRSQDAEALSYASWVAAYDTLTESDRALIRRHVEALAHRPRISIVMPVYDTPERWLRRAIESVRRQLYRDWELCIADDASTADHMRRVLEEYAASDERIKVAFRETNGHVSAASNSALDLATGEFVAFLDHDDELAEQALYLVAVELNRHPEADLLYSDEDEIGAHGRRQAPSFKPDWNLDLFLTRNLLTRLCVCRTGRVRDIGGFAAGYEGAQHWDLMMRLIEEIPPSHIRHIPHVLYHRRAVPGLPALPIGDEDYARTAQYGTLRAHFARVGLPVEILPAAGTCWRIRYPLPTPPPLVSIIVPTRDRIDLLRRCVDSIHTKTTYPSFELIVVDNQSQAPAALEYLAKLESRPGVRVVRYDAPFNFSAINNWAARQARGEILAFLNDDVEVISPDWLEEMVSQALRTGVGPVGAMLYYPNDTIQHAGVIVGFGASRVAAHAFGLRRRGYPGPGRRALVCQNVSAVTAACMVLRKSVFDEVGGMDEHDLAIAFNDVDLCLRAAEHGYRTVWTPHAELYHHESASRGAEDGREKRARFQREAAVMKARWGHRLAHDPAYNPNLSLDESFALAFPPRAEKPWRARGFAR